MKKFNEKKLKKLYIAHCESSAPDMDSIWEKIESGLDEKSENRVTSKPAMTFGFRRTAAWRAVCTAAVIAVPVVLIGINNSKNISNTSDSAVYIRNEEAAVSEMFDEALPSEEVYEDSAEEGKDSSAAPATVQTENGNADYIDTETEFYEEKIYYSDLSFAYDLRSNRPYELPYAETAGDEYFVEDKILIETDVIVDAVVDMVYSSGKGTVCYVLNAEDQDNNDIGSIVVESATPYLMKMNREYILPLKENDGEYSLVFENAPQIECTLDGGAVFHNGWESLNEDSAYLVYPQNGIDDFFYDRMRFSYTDAMAVIKDKWLLLKNSKGD